MFWLEAVAVLQERGESCVIVTVASVRGHSPRSAGAKMIVSRDSVFGSVGGGNLEAVAVKKSRVMLETNTRVPEFLEVTLTEKAVAEFGVQCCGGEVKLMLEPIIPERSQVAIFGVGHVGLALARILSTLPLEILLSDSRSEMLESTRFMGFSSVAQIRTFTFPHPSPEFVMAELKPGAFVLILTHDHSEDIGILETALHRSDLKYIGLIGSSAKWTRFQTQLKARGFTDEDLARVTTPIGVAGIRGKQPEVIAIAVAAQLLTMLEFVESSS
jgi:xanthine dehydrogenase accessory factor